MRSSCAFLILRDHSLTTFGDFTAAHAPPDSPVQEGLAKNPPLWKTSLNFLLLLIYYWCLLILC